VLVLVLATLVVGLTASRERNAVTSPPVDTMLTTDQPLADFSLSFVASAAGSYDDELTVVNSCMAAC